MSAKHTPGPWRLGRNEHPFSENYLHTAIGTKTRELAIVVFPIEDDETEANARLIAAAPDLLSTSGRKRASLEVRACCAEGRKTLALAKAAAEGAGFPQNLKFCSIYSGLDAALDSLERCAEALFKA